MKILFYGIRLIFEFVSCQWFEVNRKNCSRVFDYLITKISGDTMNSNSSLYWKTNLKIIAGCLLAWFIVSFLFGILLVEPLNHIRIGGFQLGFWFAQQGSIYSFIGLIFIYVWRMNKLDHEFNVDDDDASSSEESQ